MTPFEELLDFILKIQAWDVAKAVVCFGLLLYIVFAFIVIRQVSLMAKTLVVPIDLPIKTVVWIHFGLSIFAFLLSLVIL